ncbi:YkvA family protein [Adhaeribacter terreus]|uniref:YkvA family protein n=1 Tax=Adhaeribacter terreus TaxID=529703 RepID=A0ABW0E7S5_9BACT
MKLLQKLREKARHLNTEIYALYLAYKHPKVSWSAKIIIAITIGYALSPIDLIPDFIPVFGFLDDLLIVPAGIALSIRLIPVSVLLECRLKAMELFHSNKPKLRYAWMIVFFTWILVASIVIMLFYKLIHEPTPAENL